MPEDINHINKNKPSYNEIQTALDTLKIHHSTAELYGLLCSLFSASAQLTEQAWINGLLNQEPEQNQETQNAKDILINFFNWTHLYISLYLDNNKSDNFFIFLPDQNKEFNIALTELILFAQGFLSGLNLTQINTQTQEDPIMLEALEALTQISCLDDQSEENTKSNQESLDICIKYTQEAVHSIINKLKIPNKSELKN